MVHKFVFSILHLCRLIIRNAVNASEKDSVIFAGSGCTGAVHKLIHCLDLSNQPHPPVRSDPFSLCVYLDWHCLSFPFRWYLSVHLNTTLTCCRGERLAPRQVTSSAVVKITFKASC